MAKKGQKFKKYSKEEVKEEVIERYVSGISSKALSEEYDIPIGTIKTWARKLRKTGSLKNDIFKNRGEHKRTVSLGDYKERYEILKKYQAFLKAQREKR